MERYHIISEKLANLLFGLKGQTLASMEQDIWPGLGHFTIFSTEHFGTAASAWKINDAAAPFVRPKG